MYFKRGKYILLRDRFQSKINSMYIMSINIHHGLAKPDKIQTSHMFYKYKQITWFVCTIYSSKINK